MTVWFSQNPPVILTQSQRRRAIAQRSAAPKSIYSVCLLWHYTRWSHVVRHLSSSPNWFHSEERRPIKLHANIYRKSRWMVLSTCALNAGCRDKPLKLGKMFWTHLLPSRMKGEKLWLASRAPNWNSHNLLSSLRLYSESAARYVRQ